MKEEKKAHEEQAKISANAEEAKDDAKQGRAGAGTAIAETKGLQAFVMLFGCRPSVGVGAETVMFEEIAEALLTNFDPRSLVCLFPQALSDLIGTDSNFELSAPPSIKNLRLLYNFNIVAEIRAVIFCNSEIQGRPGAPAVEYKDSKVKCDKVGSMFKNILKVQDENVEVCHDLSKDQMTNQGELVNMFLFHL